MAWGKPDAATSADFLRPHPWDRNFHLLFVALCWLGVGNGFFVALFGRFAGKADYPAPPILQIHALAFVSWLLLLTAQVLLIRTGKTATHRRLGLTGMALVPVMVLSGLLAEVYSQRFYFDHPPNSQAFFIIPIWYSLGFGVLGGLALRARRDSPRHKRLVLLATSFIVGAAYTRWWGETLTAWVGDGYLGMLINTYTGTSLLLALLLGYDKVARGRVHPVLLAGSLFIAAGSMATTLIYHAPGWLPVARFLIGR